MKILIVSVDFPPHTDGVSTVSHELATRLVAFGEEVIVIGPSAKGDREYDSRQKFKVIRTPFYEFGYLRFIPIFLVMPFVIIRYRIKTVIAMNIAYGGIISFLFSGLLGFSYVLWAYGYEFYKFKDNILMRALYQKIYRKAQFVSAITDFVRGRLVEFGVSPEKIVVVKPGTDPEQYRPLKAESRFGNKKIILSVGRLVERKGFDMVIKAMQAIKKRVPEALYVLVGDGPYKDKLQLMAKEAGLGDAVQFAGRVSGDELASFYNACEVFIMPSRTLDKKGDIEGFGIVYLEANACGKPVIGGRDSGANEAIIDGKTGILVDPLSVSQISDAIVKCLNDVNFARVLGENGRKRVIEEFNWDRSIKQFIKQGRFENVPKKDENSTTDKDIEAVGRGSSQKPS